MDNFVPADNNYFTFKGRLARGPFIKRTLIVYAAIVILLILFYEAPMRGQAYTAVNALWFVPSIPLIIILYAGINRRFHDIGKSSKWTWMSFFASGILTIVYFLAILYLFYKKGDEGSNEYGPDPLQ